ncbi:MAG: hypothetical protein ACLFNN_02730 [Candidatus Paceibacterota bacterium]
MQNTKNENPLLLKWDTPEYPFWRKTAEWYVSMIIISGSAVFAAVMLNNLIFAAFLAVAAFALLTMASIPPKNIKVKIKKRGIAIGKKYYPYENLESFYINDFEEPPRLFLKSKSLLSPLIVTQLGEIEEEEVEETLLKKLKKEYLQESFFQKLLERLGF